MCEIYEKVINSNENHLDKSCSKKIARISKLIVDITYLIAPNKLQIILRSVIDILLPHPHIVFRMAH